MFRARARLKGQSLNKLIPNMLTLAALCAGLSGIRFALLEKWEWEDSFRLLRSPSVKGD